PPKLVVDAAGVPPEIRALLGPRWTVIGSSVILVRPIVEDGRLRLMYRSAANNGVYDATIVDGALKVTLSNKATVVVSPGGSGTLTWTSADGAQTVKGPLTPGDDH